MFHINLHIDRLSFGGSGIGRYQGKVCFVPFSCPGDELEVRITSDKRSFCSAEIVDVITPSADRITPVCPLAGRCGGCHWQHVDYAQQCAEKRDIFADALWRGARVERAQIGELVPSSLQYGYRSRAQFKLHGRGEHLQIGFYRQGTHFVEDAPEGCPVAAPVINSSLMALRAVLRDFAEPDRIPQINIDSAEQGAVAIVNYIGQDADAAADFFAERAGELAPLTGLYLQTGRKSTLRKVYGDDALYYTLPDHNGSPCRLMFRPGGFSQVNLAQNRALLELVRGMADLQGHERLLDLYCGNGNFSLPLASQVSSVTGIEAYPASIEAAVSNAAANRIENAEFVCADTASGLRHLLDQGRHFDLVVLDPPRQGAADAVSLIAALAPARVIYVSCDPGTLARDCADFRKNDYFVVSSVPVDMFPQTYHLESVTLLQKV